MISLSMETDTGDAKLVSNCVSPLRRSLTVLPTPILTVSPNRLYFAVRQSDKFPVEVLVWRKVGPGEVPRGEKMLYSGTDSESCITEHTLVCEDKCNTPCR